MGSVYDDSVKKELHLFFMTQELSEQGGYPHYVYHKFEHIQSDRIIGESANFTMGILDANKFELGSYVLPSFSVQVIYNGKSYRNKLCRVWTEFNGNSYGLIFGVVKSENLNSNRDIVTLEISSIFEQAMDIEESLRNIFREFSYQNEVITVPMFYHSLLKFTFSKTNFYDHTIFPIPNEMIINDFIERFPELAEVSLIIPEENDDVVKSISSFWKMLGELVGAHLRFPPPKIDNILGGEIENLTVDDIKIEMVRINNNFDYLIPSLQTLPNNSLYPMFIRKGTGQTNSTHSLPFYISCEYDDLEDTKFDGIYFKYGDIEFSTTVNDSPYSNCYEIKDNILFYGKNMEECAFITNRGTLNYLTQKKYIISYLDCVFNPEFQAGDTIVIETSRNELLGIPILSCDVSGVNSLRARIEARAKVK